MGDCITTYSKISFSPVEPEMEIGRASCRERVSHQV